MSTLLISEKRKAAEAIAKALGSIQVINHSKSVSLYYVKSRDLYVIPLRGHILQYKNTKLYEKWSARDPREIITNKKSIDKFPNDYAGGYISALQKYGKICNTCIIGTDADVEGCNIGYMDALPFVQKVNPRIKIQQLWLSDLQKTSIVKGYNNLIPPRWSWAYSGKAQSIIDAVIGFSATREVSLTLKPVLKSINVQFTSIGKVQTSLLYLLYLREKLIREFKSDPYWSLYAIGILKGVNIKGNHKDNNFKKKNDAEQIYNKIKNIKEGIIEQINGRSKKIFPPKPLNTSRALQLITKTLKINSKIALKTLEDLYLNKVISYPRTDSDVYSKDYDHLSILKKYITHSQYSTYVQELFKNRKTTPTKGRKDVGDHSPITPLSSLESTSSKLKSKLEKQVYSIISEHYLALFGDPAVENTINMMFTVGKEPFLSTFKSLEHEGFYSVAPFLKSRYGPIPKLGALDKIGQYKGQKIPIKEVQNIEGKTQPPPRLNDTTLLSLMEQKGLGTKSTRPTIIDILIRREYIQRKVRAIYVTELGYLLIESLVNIWKSFLDPKFTSHVESKLEDIKNQKLQMNKVIDDVRAEFLNLFDKFRNNKKVIIQNMDKLKKTGNILRGRDNKIVGSSQSSTSSSGKYGAPQKYQTTTSLCPKCKKVPMKLIKVRNKNKRSNFFVCEDENCKTYLSLPKKGNPTLLKTQCNICKFNAVKITAYKNKHKFDYYLCPACWTDALKKSIPDQGFCSKCNKFQIKNGRCIQKPKS